MTRALYRLLLRAAPRDVRGSYGGEMEETFNALYDAAARRGAVAIARLLAAELGSVIASHWMQRRDAMIDGTQSILGMGRLRQAVRSLARRPTFAGASFVTLLFGTAAMTLAFAVVDTVLLKPLPYPEPDRLVTLAEAMPAKSQRASLIAPARLEDWQQRNSTFDGIAGTYVENSTDTSGSEPERLNARYVTPRYFEVMGAAPLRGRTFGPDEERFGGARAAIISEAMWARRFQRGDAALGARLTIGGDSITIVGVMPASFAPASVDVWMPAQFAPGLLRAREARFLTGVGRLKRDVTIDQARADLVAVQAQLGTEFQGDKGWTVAVDDLMQARVGATGRTLWIVFGAVVLLWLIGVANLAGLALVQIHRRGRELAIRTAIGASRGQVMGVVIQEALLIAAAAGAAGTAAAAWLIHFIPRVFTALPRMNELHLDWRAATAAAASSAAAAVIVGVWPVAMSTRADVSGILSSASRGSTARRHFFQRGLVVAQVALSLLLVGAASLLMRSYYNLVNVDSGFSTGGVWTFHVGAAWGEDRQRIGQMQSLLLADLAASPGVEAVGFTNFLPMSRATLRSPVRIDGINGPEPDGRVLAGTRLISPDFPKVLGVPVVAGSACPELRMDFDGPRHAVVNQRFVDDFAGGTNLIGRSIRLAQETAQPFTIVGVIGDISEDDTKGRPSPYVYTCESAGTWPDPEYVVRTRNAAGLPAALRAIVRERAPGRAIFDFKPLDEVTSDLRETPRLNAAMLAVFAAAAICLAAVGLYSLFMLIVGERVREIGVRLALGATKRQVISLVWGGAGRLLAAGLAAGFGMFLLVERLIRAELFGVSPRDPFTLGASAAVLVVVSAIAIAIPASRAGRVDPLVAMRTD